jgi:hypothetical protein
VLWDRKAGLLSEPIPPVVAVAMGTPMLEQYQLEDLAKACAAREAVCLHWRLPRPLAGDFFTRSDLTGGEVGRFDGRLNAK